MGDDDLWRLVEEQRFETVLTLEQLTAEQWEAPSLCRGWTVRTVAAHLLLYATTSPTERTWAVIRYGGHDRATDHLARREAQRSPAELTASLRAAVGDQSLPPGEGPRLALTEAVVHALDMWVALRLPLEPRRAALVAVLDDLVAHGADKAFAGRHLVATDVGWHHGQGARDVRGPASAFVLALAGRPAGRLALVVD